MMLTRIARILLRHWREVRIEIRALWGLPWRT